MIKVTATAISDVGKIRNNNEDNFYINGEIRENVDDTYSMAKDDKKRESYLYSVCDGMGGEECGEVASLLAVQTLRQFSNVDISENIHDYINSANKLICDEIEKQKGRRVGTTSAVLYIKESKAFCYNIGDSRIYLLRDGNLQQISLDHTQAQSLVDMGIIAKEEMNSHKGKHKLTQHLGIFPDEIIIQPHESDVIELKKDDLFILCSDGLTDMLTDDEIAGIAIKGKTVDDVAERLIDEALLNGGKDNVTVVAVKIEKVSKGLFSKILNYS